MVRGGGTSSRNKKKKATDATNSTSTQNGVDNLKHSADNGTDKHKNVKHRKQKDDSPPVIQHQEEDQQQPQKEEKGRQLVPTSEQLRLAQITQSADNNKDPQRKAKIIQIMEITGKSEDDVATALFDCNWDETVAIEMLLDESSGFGSWEETGNKKKSKNKDKDEASRENEDFNDDFDPTNSDNRERSRNRGPPRLRNNRGSSNYGGGRGDSEWKNRENQENERNFEGGRGRGGRGMGPRGRGGHVGMAPRSRGGRGGPRGGGSNNHKPDFDRGGPGAGEGLGQIDTWNPIGAEKQENQRLRHNKDAFDNAGNWGDDFPAAEDWDNDEYTGSLSDTKVFTPSGTSAKAVGEPVNGPAPGPAPAANNSMSYSQPIDLSSLLKTGGLREYNAAASQDLKTAIGIGGTSGPKSGDNLAAPGAGYSGTSLSYSSGSNSSPYTSQHQSNFNSATPGSAFSPIKPAPVSNGSSDRGKAALPRARIPAPSRIPSSAVEMPGAGGGDTLSNLDVQFGGMDLQFGGAASSASDSNNSGLEFNAAPGQGTTPNANKDSSFAHSIQSSGSKDDSFKASPSLAPGAVKDVNQSLSSALSAAGIKTSLNSESVPGYGRSDPVSGSGSRSSDKYGGSSQRSPGPALISKPDNMGYNNQSSYPYQSSGSGGKSNYNSYSGSGQSQTYERQNSSGGYSTSNGLNSSYGSGAGAGSSSSYNQSAGQSGSAYSGSAGFNSSQQSNNFSSSYGAVTTASYSSFSNNSYSSKSGTNHATTSYLPTSTASLSQYSSSDTSTSSAASSKSSYDTSTVPAVSNSGLGLSSSVSSSSKMSINTSSGNKMSGVPGMPPGVAGVLPAQYMTPAGFPAAYLAGLGQPAAAAAMYGYGGHQLEDLAALQRSTLAASLPQLVGSHSAAAGQPGGSGAAGSSQIPAKGPSSGYYDPSSQFGASTGGVATNSTLQGGPGQGPASGTRQDGQNSFGDTSKFAASSDSTSSPVPSTVGNTVGQPTPFNLASSFTAAAAQHPTLPPGYAYFYGGVGGMPGLQYGAGGGVYPGTHPGIPVPTAAGPTSTSQFQNKAYGSSYGTGYDSLSLGQSNSGYVNSKYGASDSNQSKAGGSSNNTAGTAYWSNSLW